MQEPGPDASILLARYVGALIATRFKRYNAYARQHSVASYRSGLEDRVASQIAAAGLPVLYETLPLPYRQPSKVHKYTPDFILPNGIVIESKGMFTVEDRNKMVLVKQQHPNLDIRLVFSNPQSRLYKRSPTSYALWCDRMGFPWARKEIPAPWFTEAPNHKSLAALKALGYIEAA
jgi:hypothetical protein